ncbi:short neuropeptide F isoform X2 [Hermetia illucens]|uniref:short neuropeptide F isoform X2 n=1 Tax=Hermetia illucens TaxID=343691 RepID=UPI0018CC1369|nr:short neuropeptide F isoform X2 [Hermetia illucens]
MKWKFLIMKHQKITSIFVFVFIVTISEISALPPSFDSSLNELYENLLQREYAGPISFPNHQVERKAQRSPSLRLRFGRSDPDILQSMEKRWFGDVHQKPIRSPSLRLRFGRRSDPMMSVHEGDNSIDENNYDRVTRQAPLEDDNGDRDVAALRVRRDISNDAPLEQKRAPSLRLRFGRDPYKVSAAQVMADRNELEREILATLLQALNEYDYNDVPSDDFIRETRKPAPLRLRFGRSVDLSSLKKSPTDNKPVPSS